MKKLISTVAFLLAGSFVYESMAQSVEDDIQIIQGAWGKQKRELVSIAMELSAKDSVKFWPVYEKYEVARKKIGGERLKILDEYVSSYETLTSAKADQLVTRLFKNEAANNQLLQQYYVSMKTALNAMQATKFLHIETFLQSYIKIHLQANLPYIGDLEHLQAK